MRQLTALLESIFVSPKAAGKSNLGNHSKFPLCLVPNWFENIWKVPLELAPYVSRTETDLPRFVCWRLQWSWRVPGSVPLPDSHVPHKAAFAASGHGVCRPTVPPQRVFCLRWLALTCVLTCRIMSFSINVDAYQVTWGLKGLAHRAAKQQLWLNFAFYSFPSFLLSHSP